MDKLYDELADTFRQDQNPSNMSGRKPIAMKDAGKKRKNKMQAAIHIRIENNGSPEEEEKNKDRKNITSKDGANSPSS